MQTLTMYGICEPGPGPRWRALFDATWPAYRRWYLSEGLEARPSLIEAASSLARPEFLRVKILVVPRASRSSFSIRSPCFGLRSAVIVAPHWFNPRTEWHRLEIQKGRPPASS